VSDRGEGAFQPCQQLVLRTALEHLAEEGAPGLQDIARELDCRFGQGHDAQMVRPGVAGPLRRHVGEEHLGDDEPDPGERHAPEPLVAAHRKRVVELARERKIPIVSALRSFAEEGGLLAYGANVPGLFRQAAGYVDRILKGEKPGDLPVQAPTQYELVINLRTAKAFGLSVPPPLLARAAEVIE